MYESVMNFIANYYDIILMALALVEAILRLFPTTKNWSIIDNIRNLINFFVPNRGIENQNFKIKPVAKRKGADYRPNSMI